VGAGWTRRRSRDFAVAPNRLAGAVARVAAHPIARRLRIRRRCQVASSWIGYYLCGSSLRCCLSVGCVAADVDEASCSSTRFSRRPPEVLLVAGLYLVYDLLRASVGVAEPRAERNGFTVLRWEKSVHVDPEHLMNHLMTGAAYLAVPACFFYAAAYLIVTPAVLIWTYRRRSAAYCRARTILAVITATALLGFWIYPTAPPRLLIGGGFADTLAVYRSWGWWGGADSVPAGMKSISNQFAAMPSLHVAWSLWCALGCTSVLGQ
jgi:hypothetical protein